jgi:hypothetical protein
MQSLAQASSAKRWSRLKTPEKTSGCRGQRANLAGKLGYYAIFLDNCKDCVQLGGKNVGNRGYPVLVSRQGIDGEVAAGC